ncbi:hypothetical protein C2S52_012378 [Perilla frutescens var. hirtella]|nr:hypothetical protein C2S52_012378 [Perilla frutescens var. hirtella]
MALPAPISQDLTFYTAPWTQEIDRACLDQLLYYYCVGKRWVPGDDQRNLNCLPRIKVMIRNRFGVDIPLLEFVSRVDHWRHRYQMFSWLIKYVGEERLDLYTRLIDADRWNEVLVYMNQAEDECEFLKRLFDVGEQEVLDNDVGEEDTGPPAVDSDEDDE